MKFNLRKLYRTVSLTLLFVASWATFAHAATQDVRVTNWPTSYSVVNTTWDSRLSTLQTTLQSLAADMSQFPTFVSRFGWNGTTSFSQGFELLYNDVHSLATATSQSDILTAFNREFPLQSGTNPTKSTIVGIYNRIGTVIDSFRPVLNSLDSYTQHIDSDIHSLQGDVSSIDSSLIAIDDSTNTIKNRINTYLPLMKVDLDNIAVDTEAINTYSSNLPSMASDLSTLQEFFADADAVQHKADAQASSNEALDNFTGNGSSAASVNDYSMINDMSSSMQAGFGTGSVDPAGATDLINGNNQNAWAWFSQATYDSINPAPSRGGLLNADSYMAFYQEQLSSNTRKGSSDNPLLDRYYKDIIKAVGN